MWGKGDGGGVVSSLQAVALGSRAVVMEIDVLGWSLCAILGRYIWYIYLIRESTFLGFLMPSWGKFSVKVLAVIVRRSFR